MPALLVDAFGTICEIRPPWTEMREVCFRECIEGSGIDLVDFFPAYEAERKVDHERAAGDWREFDFRDRFLRAFRRLGHPEAERLATVARDHYHRFQGRYITPLPDAHEGLEDLAQIGPICLLSNYPHGPTLVDALAKAGLAHHFRDHVVSGDVGWLKPSPHLFHEAALRLDAEPADCVVIGNDAHDDVGGARAAGMRAILVAYPRGVPHAVPEGALGVAADLPEAARIVRDRLAAAPRGRER